MQALLIVIASYSTSPDSSMFIVLTIKLYLKGLLFPRIIDWIFPGRINLKPIKKILNFMFKATVNQRQLLAWEHKALRSPKITNVWFYNNDGIT